MTPTQLVILLRADRKLISKGFAGIRARQALSGTIFDDYLKTIDALEIEEGGEPDEGRGFAVPQSVREMMFLALTGIAIHEGPEYLTGVIRAITALGMLHKLDRNFEETVRAVHAAAPEGGTN